jgi:D-alanyl-D-alanine carboxypeptidase (penicillin-binding protein 5/6)
MLLGPMRRRNCVFLVVAVIALSVLPAVAPAAASTAGRGGWLTGPRVGSAGAAIATERPGPLLWGKRADTRLPIASITKVMTALVVITDGHLGRRIQVPYAVAGYVQDHGASSAGLRPGDVLTTRQLLAALLLPSGADAAYALASAYGPGLGRFVGLMNATARSLGLTRTRFTNFDGLPYPSRDSDYSTPRDLIALGRAAMSSPVFRSMVRRRYYWLPAGPGHRKYLWLNDNPLLGSYPGATGIKTGWTPYAGRCLLFAATRGGRSFIGVTLDSGGSGPARSRAAAVKMLNWAFAASRQQQPSLLPVSAGRLAAVAGGEERAQQLVQPFV